METFDFMADASGDIFFEDGDFAYGESTLQHQQDLLLAYPGDFRQWPVIGAAIRTEILNTYSPDELRVRIQREMERDGMRIKLLRIYQDEIIEMVATYA